MVASPSSIRLGTVDGASKEQRRRLVKLVDSFRNAAAIVGLHPDTEIEVCFGVPEDGEKWLMRVDTNRGQYLRWKVEVSPLSLEPSRDHIRASDVIHECLHMLIFDYSSVALAMCSQRAGALLQDKEETLVTHLEHAICRLMGAGWK